MGVYDKEKWFNYLCFDVNAMIYLDKYKTHPILYNSLVIAFDDYDVINVAKVPIVGLPRASFISLSTLNRWNYILYFQPA